MEAGNPRVQPRPLRIVFASHTFCGGPFVVGSHHLAREIAVLGHKVVHLSTPVTPLHFLRIDQAPDARARTAVWRDGGVARNGGFLEYVPLGLVPWALAGPIYAQTGLNLANMTLPRMSSYLRRNGLPEIDALIVDQPAFVGLHEHLHVRALILRSTDHLGTLRGHARQTAEIAIARISDGLVGTSQLVLDGLRAVAPDKPAALISNGVQIDNFVSPRAQPAEFHSIRPPILVYVGAIDDRFDREAVFALARSCPDLSIVLIGPKPTGPPWRPPENVHLLGPRPYDQLGGYLQHADLGLLPFSDHPANAGRSPMKLYEYAAAGLRVVARRTAELERRNEPFIFCYGRQSEMPAVCRKTLALPSSREMVKGRAIQQSWTEKARTLLQFVTHILERKEHAQARR
jgi:glycosyltransferase involved in cell wall biosynthesis